MLIKLEKYLKIEMSANHWGKYRNASPRTHFDPLQSFIDDGHPVGFRVNFMPGRRKRPREQHIKVQPSFIDDPVTQEEIDNSPLYKVLTGQEMCIAIAGDDQILGEPDEDPQYRDLRSYDGISIMNKYAPLGINTQEATGVALVNYPTSYIRSLENSELNVALLRPMRTSLKHLMEGNTYRDDLRTPLCFFNIGPSSGASIKYLHSQTYALPNMGGINSYAFRRSFDAGDDCLACKIATNDIVTDHLGQEIDYRSLTVWENDLCRVIIPYAPLRTMATRIVPKEHVNYIGNASDSLLDALGEALKYADYLMNAATPPGRSVRLDRTIPFRQTSKVGVDFHMFVDLLPPFPLVAAETVDFLGMTPYPPADVAEHMRSIDLDDKDQK